MSGETTGVIRTVLRFEGLLVMLAAMLTYDKFGAGWSTFAWFFLVPDISFLGYLAGARVGAISYNAAHSYIGAVACLIASQLLAVPLLLTVGTIWCAHIGFDRALGYGLKYATGFKFTHLGRIGRAG
ncbi:MAG: DUF4260 domain-containing protein [Gallionella sp.]|nr:DUF4260 domain-containing protein [Gallionella sp.]